MDMEAEEEREETAMHPPLAVAEEARQCEKLVWVTVMSDPPSTDRTEPLPDVREMFVKEEEDKRREESDLSEMREEEEVKLQRTEYTHSNTPD